MSHRLSGRLSGTAARASTPWRAVARSALLLWGIGLAATTALAQVSVNQVLFPSNIGRTLDATVSIDYTRTSAAAATISVAIPPQLSANPPAPPAGCVAVGSPAMQLDCSVPAGSTGSGGTITFDVRGATLATARSGRP